MDNRIKIVVKPQYVPERSDPVRSYYVFAYHITITNQGKHTSQLLSRYWHITDGQGNAEDVHGPGVVGQSPNLKHVESFVYSRFCPLPTPMGFMEGAFRMVYGDGEEFDAQIKPFRLVAPQVLN